MHLVANILSLTFDLHSGLFPESDDLICHCGIVHCHLGCVDNHHHVEETLDDGLGNVKDIDLMVCHIGADLGDDADCVFADHGNDSSVHVFFFHITAKIVMNIVKNDYF